MAKELMLTNLLIAADLIAASSKFLVVTTQFIKEPGKVFSDPAARWNITATSFAALAQSSLDSKLPSITSARRFGNASKILCRRVRLLDGLTKQRRFEKPAWSNLSTTFDPIN